MHAKLAILPQVAVSDENEGGAHVTLLHWVSWISWIAITSSPSPLAPKSHIATCAQMGAGDTWDAAERKPNGLLFPLFR